MTMKITIWNLHLQILCFTDCFPLAEELYMKKGKIAQASHISLWRGDISETIKAAIANGSVTPFLINIAPMVSPL